MKSITLAAFWVLISLVAFAQPADPGIVSPEISTDRRVTFRLAAPKATTVLLGGDFMKGQKPFAKDDRGRWSITVGPIEPEVYHYYFMIDGVRMLDPNNAAIRTGAPASLLASILEVRGDTPAFYDDQPTPHGEVRTVWYASKAQPAQRRLVVYTPPGYDAEGNRGTRYPALYLLHGASGDETVWTRLGRANLIVDNLLATEKAKPFLVVMPLVYGVPPEQFTRDLLEDVVPFIDTHYRTQADREHRAIAGTSTGGTRSLNIGLNHLDTFSAIGAFGAGLGRTADFSARFPVLTAEPGRANEQLRLLWLGCGSEDAAFASAKQLSASLTEHKIKHTFRETSGDHTYVVFRRCLFELVPLLF